MPESYPVFLTLRIPRPADIRLAVREALQQAFGEGVRIQWGLIWDELTALNVPLADIAIYKKRVSNFSRNPPLGASNFVLALLFWMHSRTEALYPRGKTPHDLANSLWHDLHKTTLDGALNALHAELHRNDPRDEMRGQARPANHWVLSCSENMISEPRFLSLALRDFQRPATAGALGIYLEVFAAQRPIDDEITAGFRKVAIETNLNVNDAAEIQFSEAYSASQDVGDSAALRRKGAYLSYFWELGSKRNTLDGNFVPDAELFSLRPKDQSVEFAATMQVELKDLELEGADAYSRNKQAIFRALFVKAVPDGQRNDGIATVAMQRYRVEKAG